MPKRKVRIQTILFENENEVGPTAHSKYLPNESNGKRLRSSAQSSGKFKEFRFEQKIGNVDADNSNIRGNSLLITKAKENGFLKNEDLSKNNKICDSINFIPEDDEGETGAQKTLRSRSITCENYYLKLDKNPAFVESSKLSIQPESNDIKEDFRRLEKDLDNHRKNGNSMEQKSKKIKRVLRRMFSRAEIKNKLNFEQQDNVSAVRKPVSNDFLSDSINYLADCESEDEDSSLSQVKNLDKIDKKNFGFGSTVHQNETSRYFSSRITQTLSSEKENNLIDRFKLNHKSSASNFTPKFAEITDTIKFIFESESELDDGNDSAVINPAFQNNNEINLGDRISNSAKVADRIRFISDSENEDEQILDISTKDSTNYSEHLLTFTNPSFKKIDDKIKLDKTNFILEWEKEPESNALDQYSTDDILSPKKTRQTGNAMDVINFITDLENEVEEIIEHNIDTSHKADRCQNLEDYSAVAKKPIKNIDGKSKLLKDERENAFNQQSSNSFFSLKKNLQPSKDVDEIDFISDSQYAADNSLERLTTFDDKLLSSYVWNHQLSPIKFDFNIPKISEINERELIQLNEMSNKTDKEKKFLKIVGKEKLPSFFFGSVCEIATVDCFSGRMDLFEDQ